MEPMADPRPNRWRWLTRDRIVLAGLLLFALVVRGAVLFALRGNLQQDPDAYREIAENLLNHGTFALGKRGQLYDASQPLPPTAYRPPLYPVLLSNLATPDRQAVSLVKVAVMHLLLGVGTVLLTWLTARRMQNAECGTRNSEIPIDGVHIPTRSVSEGNPRDGSHVAWSFPLLAGVLVACDPLLLNQQALVMTETLATFLAVLALWCLARFDARREWFNAALAGAAIGLAALCRPTFLPWLGLVGMGVLLVRIPRGSVGVRERGRGREFAWRVANCAALGLAAALVLSPWVIRNYQVFGKPIVTTTHGGYTLWLGNNESFYDWLREDETGLPWDVDRRDGKPPTAEELNRQFEILVLSESEGWESAEDLFHKNLAYKAIAAHPATFARACLYRVGELWSPLPNQLTADESTSRMLLRYVTAAWYGCIYLLAAIGIWKLRLKLLASPWLWGVLLCVAFTVVHTFYWSNLRMRAPLIPFVAIVAAVALLPGDRRNSWSVE
jgi:hypothetical protein